METTFNEIVSDLSASKKESLEAVLGRQLEAHQRVVIHVLEVEANRDESTRREAMMRAAQIAKEGRAAAEAQGFIAPQADAAIDDAINEVRKSGR
jgi:hypothetical protein